MGRNYAYNPHLSGLRATMEKQGIEMPVPRCFFCNSDDLRIGGNERESYVACPECGADGPIARGEQGAVRAYSPKEK